MSAGQSGNQKTASTPETEELRASIGETRAELADTAQALRAKADGKSRATKKAHAAVETARQNASDLAGKTQRDITELAAKAQETAHVVGEKAKATANRVADAPSAKVSGPVARSVRKASDNRGQVIIGVTASLLLLAILRRRRTRRRNRA